MKYSIKTILISVFCGIFVISATISGFVFPSYNSNQYSNNKITDGTTTSSITSIEDTPDAYMGAAVFYDVDGDEAVFYDKFMGKTSFNNVQNRQIQNITNGIYDGLNYFYGDGSTNSTTIYTSSLTSGTSVAIESYLGLESGSSSTDLTNIAYHKNAASSTNTLISYKNARIGTTNSANVDFYKTDSGTGETTIITEEDLENELSTITDDLENELSTNINISGYSQNDLANIISNNFKSGESNITNSIISKNDVGTSGGLGFIWPTNPNESYISSIFKIRNFGGDIKEHSSIDIASSEKNIPVYACCDSTVVGYYFAQNTNDTPYNYNSNNCTSSFNGGWGNSVVIRYNTNPVINGKTYSVFLKYNHLYGIISTLTVGGTLQQGEPIGFIGNTGYSEGEHLDFQIILKEGTDATYSYSDSQNGQTYPCDPLLTYSNGTGLYFFSTDNSNQSVTLTASGKNIQTTNASSVNYSTKDAEYYNYSNNTILSSIKNTPVVAGRVTRSTYITFVANHYSNEDVSNAICNSQNIIDSNEQVYQNQIREGSSVTYTAQITGITNSAINSFIDINNRDNFKSAITDLFVETNIDNFMLSVSNRLSSNSSISFDEDDVSKILAMISEYIIGYSETENNLIALDFINTYSSGNIYNAIKNNNTNNILNTEISAVDAVKLSFIIRNYKGYEVVVDYVLDRVLELCLSSSNGAASWMSATDLGNNANYITAYPTLKREQVNFYQDLIGIDPTDYSAVDTASENGATTEELNDLIDQIEATLPTASRIKQIMFFPYIDTSANDGAYTNVTAFNFDYFIYALQDYEDSQDTEYMIKVRLDVYYDNSNYFSGYVTSTSYENSTDPNVIQKYFNKNIMNGEAIYIKNTDFDWSTDVVDFNLTKAIEAELGEGMAAIGNVNINNLTTEQDLIDYMESNFTIQDVTSGETTKQEYLLNVWNNFMVNNGNDIVANVTNNYYTINFEYYDTDGNELNQIPLTYTRRIYTYSN